MADRDPRFELLTPRGHGGVAVVAVRGADRWARVEAFVSPRSGEVPAGDAPSGGASSGGASSGGWPRLAVLRCGGVVVDEVLLVDRPEVQVLEIHLHGAPAVVREFERVVGGFAPPVADRADRLVQAARSRAQLALALEQRETDLAEFLASSPSRAELDAALDRSRIVSASTCPRRLVICGDQNAGKSTLMNRLLFRERVLTGELPGLTRDPVAEATLLDGYPYELVDTAGEGPVGVGEAAAIDYQARELGRRERRDGLLLLVVDGSRAPSVSDIDIRNDHTLVVRSKSDLSRAVWPADFAADVTVTCLAPDSAAVVCTGVGGALRRFRGLPPAGPVGGVAALSPTELVRLEQARDEFATGRS